MSRLTRRSLPAAPATISCRAGSIALHGRHQGAPNSTTTGTLLASTSSAKVASVTSSTRRLYGRGSSARCLARPSYDRRMAATLPRNSDLADQLELLADLSEILGEQSFRVLAYRR